MSSFFPADNYTLSLRRYKRISNIQRPVDLVKQCNKDAEGRFVKVLLLCLLLMDISDSLKILDNICVIMTRDDKRSDFLENALI